MSEDLETKRPRSWKVSRVEMYRFVAYKKQKLEKTNTRVETTTSFCLTGTTCNTDWVLQ